MSVKFIGEDMCPDMVFQRYHQVEYTADTRDVMLHNQPALQVILDPNVDHFRFVILFTSELYIHIVSF